jgi:hypothetical protein
LIVQFAAKNASSLVEAAEYVMKLIYLLHFHFPFISFFEPFLTKEYIFMKIFSLTYFLSSYCDGIDINCGCPQKWVIKEGYGGALLEQPELLQEMIRWTKERTGLPVSIKIRIDKDLRSVLSTPSLREMTFFVELILSFDNEKENN